MAVVLHIGQALQSTKSVLAELCLPIRQKYPVQSPKPSFAKINFSSNLWTRKGNKKSDWNFERK